MQSQISSTSEQLPVFSDCESTTLDKQEACFYNTIQNFFFDNFKVPESEVESNYKGNVVALFETDTLGEFKVIYVDALTEDLKKETKRIFGLLPKVKPATYSGRKVYSKFTIKIPIPLQKPQPYSSETVVEEVDKTNSKLIDNTKILNEFEAVSQNYKPYENDTFNSKLNISFSHLNYSNFDALMN